MLIFSLLHPVPNGTPVTPVRIDVDAASMLFRTVLWNNLPSAESLIHPHVYGIGELTHLRNQINHVQHFGAFPLDEQQHSFVKATEITRFICMMSRMILLADLYMINIKLEWITNDVRTTCWEERTLQALSNALD